MDSHWLDGTPVNKSFNYDTSCDSCVADCCAMIMRNDDYHKRMGFRDCNLKIKAVCVLDEEKTLVLPKDPASLTKLYGELSSSIRDLSEKHESLKK